jgi:hypothetical protein
MSFDVTFKDGRRTVTPRPVIGEPLALDPERKRPVRQLTFAATPTGPVTVALIGPTELALLSVTEKKALVGGTTRVESRQLLPYPRTGRSRRCGWTGAARTSSSGHPRAGSSTLTFATGRARR